MQEVYVFEKTDENGNKFYLQKEASRLVPAPNINLSTKFYVSRYQANKRRLDKAYWSYRRINLDNYKIKKVTIKYIVSEED